MANVRIVHLKEIMKINQCFRILAQIEGIIAGITSGANLKAAIYLSREEKYFGKNIVTITTDSLFRYISTELLDDKIIEQMNRFEDIQGFYNK